mmetsp:Transcript_14166/g.29900  ORF Transcript_14166/g.29900 Transcript_14166/m.29900 type:complete len:201 (+) Transcript_14166:228-830(+)
MMPPSHPPELGATTPARQFPFLSSMPQALQSPSTISHTPFSSRKTVLTSDRQLLLAKFAGVLLTRVFRKSWQRRCETLSMGSRSTMVSGSLRHRGAGCYLARRPEPGRRSPPTAACTSPPPSLRFFVSRCNGSSISSTLSCRSLPTATLKELHKRLTFSAFSLECRPHLRSASRRFRARTSLRTCLTRTCKFFPPRFGRK